MTTILVVEDDANLRYGLTFNLTRQGWTVRDVETAEEGLEIWRHERPDLILLDVMLPGASGMDMLRAIRNEDRRTPITMLTARSDESDAILALSLGADDYVRKPFGEGELVARLTSMLRRTSLLAPSGPCRLGPWTLDLTNLRATHDDGREHALTTKEVEVLRLLLEHPGEVLRREDLLERIWGVGALTPTRTLDNHIARLRKKLEDDPAHPRLLLTVHGVGYKTHA
jgi:two-component system alkaline phosphatase synthesis response regulator PhoP